MTVEIKYHKKVHHQMHKSKMLHINKKTFIIIIKLTADHWTTKRFILFTVLREQKDLRRLGIFMRFLGLF